jgi:acetyl-CoA synthetase
MSEPWTNTTPEERVQELIAWYGGPEASIAALLCDIHPVEATAYTVIEADLSATILTYGELKERSERFAAALVSLGVRPGDRVATLMGKSVDFLVTLVGTWRAGAISVPLFTAFAPPAIAERLTGSDAKVVVCDAAQRPKLTPSEDMPAGGWHIVQADRRSGAPLTVGSLDFDALLAGQEPGFPATALGGEAPFIQIFTSGTTGRPKSVLVPTKALAAFRTYMEYGLDVRRDDVYWCAADPGWAYGLYFGVIGSFTLGVPSILLHAGFSAETTYGVLERFGVTNFAAAPTVFRSLRASDATPPRALTLRVASAAGEPLTPEVNGWAKKALGVLVHDHYGQTEAGMLVNNHHHPGLRASLKVGSMGKAMPGWSLQVLHDDRDEIAPANTLGRIAIRLQESPLAWFVGYDGNPEKTTEKFSCDRQWHYTGDAGCVDADGDFFFSSRDDDVIIMAGYRIGPADVESVLLTHPGVAEATVIAVPDEVRGEVIEAHVVLLRPEQASNDLAVELQKLVKTKFAAHAYPREVHFRTEIPKTPSGKVQRFRLREERRAQLEAEAR